MSSRRTFIKLSFIIKTRYTMVIWYPRRRTRMKENELKKGVRVHMRTSQQVAVCPALSVGRVAK